PDGLRHDPTAPRVIGARGTSMQDSSPHPPPGLRARHFGSVSVCHSPSLTLRVGVGSATPTRSVSEAETNTETLPTSFQACVERIMAATGMNDPDYKYGGKYRLLSPAERARLGI